MYYKFKKNNGMGTKTAIILESHSDRPAWKEYQVFKSPVWVTSLNL